MQLITTKDKGRLTIVRSFAAAGGLHLVELPNQCFCRWDGSPIQSETEITTAIPEGPAQRRALHWWATKDTADAETPRRPVGFVDETLIYLDTGTRLTTFAEVLEAFPTPGPMQDAMMAMVTHHATPAPQALMLHGNRLAFAGDPAPPPETPAPSPRKPPRGEGGRYAKNE